MSDSTPARKSGRQRVPNRKYTNDAFETLNLVLSSDTEDEGILQQNLLLQDDSDEFASDAIAEEPDEGDEDSESAASDASDGSAIATPVEEYEDAHSYASSEPEATVVPVLVRHASAAPARKAARQAAKRQFVPRDRNVHSRGMPDNPLRQDQTRGYVKLFSGEGIEDIVHIVKARDQWAVDPTLPSRSRLCHGPSHTEDKRHMEATVGWDWYYDQGGRETFAKRQNVEALDADKAQLYSGSRSNYQDFVMGPYGRQRKFSLPSFHALDLDPESDAIDEPIPRPKRRKHGWMLDVGSRVKCMDWAPNQDGNSQYLALGIAQSTLNPKKPPAFRPTPGPSAIQLWEFANTSPSDSSQLPVLRILLCMEWGDVNQVKWCPMPRTPREDQAGSPPSTNSLGLLAVVFGDGITRVLDVQYDQSEGATVHAQKYNSAAFEVRPPPGTLSTCLTWLSPTDLAIGYSDGHLSIYDIYPNKPPSPPSPPSNPPSQESSADPKPWLSLPLHSTYITSLTSAYPTHPTLLLSTSLSGHLRLTSLLAPTTDYVFSSRTRTPPSTLAYCDSILSVVGAEDASETVKVWGLRCFYVNFTCGKLPSPPGPGNGIIDVGKRHSTIATGCTDGSVLVTNPMRKILGKKQPGYQQVVFKHEWRPTSSTTVLKSREQGTRRPGICRITDDYKGAVVGLGNRNNFRNVRETVPTTTIYEEETSVTALAWNPNVCCGGWLAVGWGSGLVRVQDLAID